MQTAFCPSCGADRRAAMPADRCVQCGAPAMVVHVQQPLSRYAATEPSRGLCIAGGVLSIITSLVLATICFVGMAFIPEDPHLEPEALTVAAVMLAVLGVVGIVGIVAGAMACAAKPGWTLTSAIHMTLWAVLFLLATAGGQVGALFFVVLAGLAAFFCFRGVKQARTWQEYKSMKHLPDVF